MSEDRRESLWAIRQNPPMPMSSKEKQEAYRARNAMLGLTEVRGIFLPPELHAELKAHAQKLAKRVEARTADTEVLPAKGAAR